jgi:hypothetical protein
VSNRRYRNKFDKRRALTTIVVSRVTSIPQSIVFLSHSSMSVYLESTFGTVARFECNHSVVSYPKLVLLAPAIYDRPVEYLLDPAFCR